MKIGFISLLAIMPIFSFASTDIESIKSLDIKASNYRLLAIECITDIKLTKRSKLEIESCKLFHSFVATEYPRLKSDLEEAQNNAKIEGSAEGLNSPELREKLVLIMSARSHMNIAGTISRDL
ncbi:MAG: hypothetical protein EP315_05535 [Gammaproteobacteria bacterium]|nr:MAG: hypothetical protein EP315_05535 [Gammaproteobacteria bacterium]